MNGATLFGHWRTALAGAGLLGLILGPTPAQAEAWRSAADDTGRQVRLADRVERIADAWYAHHALLMTLGAGSRIVATVNHASSRPWMFRLQPSLHRALAVSGTSFNVEALLAAGVELTFVSAGDRHALALEQAGLPVARMGFSDLHSLAESLTHTARLLGTEEAARRAADYNAYLADSLREVHAATDWLSPEQRPKVLHIASLNPLKVDGADTLIDDWIAAAGGRNAARGLRGNLQTVSAEQVLAWQPDVLILAASAGSLDNAPGAALLQQTEAVRQGRVLRNPDGVFPWDRYGTEVALQIHWAAGQLHPALFPQQDMLGRTMAFYARFFDHPLSREEAQRILDGLPPPVAP